MYYDKEGNRITMLEWAKLFEDKKYQIIKQEKIKDYFVSTIWLGLDHSFGSGAPLIFETMVFENGHEKDSDRYTTLSEAMAGHESFVAEYKSKQS